jgi:hypothetical protein
MVSHVISPAARRHPLTLLRRKAHDKARLAAALQVALPRYRDQIARVAFGTAQKADRLDPKALCATMSAQMTQLIQASGPDEQAPDGLAETAA